MGREAVSKQRRRQRIIEAAAELLVNRGTPPTVDEVADRAGVSRRTVFNYFPSVDDLIIAVGTDALSGLIESLHITSTESTTGSDDPAVVFAELATALHRIDLVDAVVRLTRILGDTGYENPRIAALVRSTFVTIADRLVTTLTDHHPTADPFRIELMVSSVIGGVMVVYTNWVQRVGLSDSEDARRVWTELFEIHLRAVRDGYLAPSPPITRD